MKNYPALFNQMQNIPITCTTTYFCKKRIEKEKEKRQQSKEPYNLNELHILDHMFDNVNELNIDFNLSHYTKTFTIEKLSNFISGVYYFIKWYQKKKKKLAVSNNFL